MIDVHAHFAGEGYAFPEEWEKIKAAGVTSIILAGDTLEHTRVHAAFCATHEGAYFAAGVHPSELKDFGTQTLSALKTLGRSEKCVAVGEIGLDYHYPDPDKTMQERAFRAQILLAEELSLPVQIHSRDAYFDTVRILNELCDHLKRGFLLHCYSYGAEHIEEFVKLGAYFSFGGVTCFKNAKNVWASVVACPLERILSETDSPYLSPFRGEKNSPANIPVIVKKLAEIKGISFREMQEQIGANAKALFPKLK